MWTWMKGLSRTAMMNVNGESAPQLLNSVSSSFHTLIVSKKYEKRVISSIADSGLLISVSLMLYFTRDH